MKRERGYVLLQVMFVFAILMVIVSQVAYKQRIQVERTRHSLFLSQAQAYAESAEAIAKVGLTLDQQNSETDHLYELWNTSEGMFPLDEGGLIQLQLDDLQGRFNVNWLAPSSGYADSALKALKKLLFAIDSQPEIADELSQWFNSDSGIDFNYTDETPAYSPAFREMADLSELLLLKSVEPEEYQRIRPYLSALPSNTALNINTAPVEVLQSIAVFITQDIAEKAVTDRGETGFTAVTDFRNQEVFKENEDAGIYLGELSVTSEWFELYTAVTLDEKTLTQRTQLHRDESGTVTLTMRDRSAKEANPMPGDPVKGLTAGNPSPNALPDNGTEQK